MTPRTWKESAESQNELQKWREKKRKRDGWKEVVVIDSVMLQDWLEQCPAVAARFARYELGLMPKLALGARKSIGRDRSSPLNYLRPSSYCCAKGKKHARKC